MPTQSNPLSLLFNPNGQATIYDTTASVSTSSGALQVRGGLGVGGSLYAGNIYSNGVLLERATSPATPTAQGTVFGWTTSTTCNIALGYLAGNTSMTGAFNVAIGTVL